MLRARQQEEAGRKWPPGRKFETPGLESMIRTLSVGVDISTSQMQVDLTYSY